MAPKPPPIPDPTSLTTDALHREVRNIREILDFKFNDLEEQFQRRLDAIEHTRLEQKADTQREISAALSAQKEAVSKSEIAFEKQINALGSESRLVRDALSEKIGALEARINRTGGMSEQNGVQRVEAREKQAWLIPMVATAVLTLLGIVVEIVWIVSHH